MSLILEALRKSEAERRRGQSPQLFDPPVAAAPIEPVRSVRTLAWAVPAVLSAALLGVWRYGASPEPAGGLSASAARAADAMPARTPPPDATAPPAAAGGRVSPPAPSTPAPSRPLSADAASARTGPVAIADLPPPAPARPSAVARPAASSPAASSATAALAGPPAASVLRADDTRPPASVPAPSARMPTPPSPPVRAATPALAATAAPAGDPAAEPLRLADLSPDERRRLPPLKMSMHMWSPEAARRFVILDGARMGEGDRVGDAVLAEITGDGAVLAWSGRRVKVPVR